MLSSDVAASGSVRWWFVAIVCLCTLCEGRPLVVVADCVRVAGVWRGGVQGRVHVARVKIVHSYLVSLVGQESQRNPGQDGEEVEGNGRSSVVLASYNL